ncbi:hypothetical protein kps4_80 [Klebsiella phage KpS4]|nr:hypothetical protein kps4_80 [Klebsiella phage KpS4]
MKLQRESINLGSEYNGKWNFVIMDSDADKIEAVEEALCEMATGFSVGGEEKTWATTATNAHAMTMVMAPASGFRSKMFRLSKRRTRQRRKQ